MLIKCLHRVSWEASLVVLRGDFYQLLASRWFKLMSNENDSSRDD